jgi:hypothetical protein
MRGPTLGAKRFLVFLAGEFEGVGFFFLAVGLLQDCGEICSEGKTAIVGEILCANRGGREKNGKKAKNGTSYEFHGRNSRALLRIRIYRDLWLRGSVFLGHFISASESNRGQWSGSSIGVVLQAKILNRDKVHTFLNVAEVRGDT